jgi:hypothetical protein
MTRQQDRRSVWLIALAWPSATPRICPRSPPGVAALRKMKLTVTDDGDRRVKRSRSWPTTSGQQLLVRRFTHPHGSVRHTADDESVYEVAPV